MGRVAVSGALLLVVGLLVAAGPAGAARSRADTQEETLRREAYIPLPEFRSHPELDRLSLEGVTLVRVRRPNGSEALVAREASGWEHVILEGYRLTFYSQARQPLRPTTGRHVIMQDWSGGAHCCFDYYVLHVVRGHVRREGLIRAGDCNLRVADIDQDGSLELIGCDARFAYGFELPFAESPLLPLVYTFRENRYVADNRRYPQVFRYRIAQERRRLAEATRAGDSRGGRRAVLSLVLHMLYAGRVSDAWCTFEQDYLWADRAVVKREILDGLRKAPDMDDLRAPRVDLSYALAPPKRCP